MNNEALISLITFVDKIIEQWVEERAVIDPEYGYMNDENEDAGLRMKSEFRSLLNAVIFSKELS